MEIISLLLKHQIIRLSTILYFFFLIQNANSQKSGERFANQNCEYVYFINDTLVDFMLIGGSQGSIATIYHGIGKYEIKNEQLAIFVCNYKIDSLIIKNDIDSNCSSFIEKVDGIDKYKIEMISNKAMKLIGPIIENYHSFNKRRFIKSFLNWPWKWSFKKQHWYDPRIRYLNKQSKM